MIGKTLAHYEITALLGEGGMGRVYQATDTKLGRAVALKILPDSFADDPQRLSRFKREAQVLASINHPNIGAIYGLEEQGAVQALVLELISGETLAERIAKGPIPVEEALPIAIQIADALEAAHEKGIIHRDLKPANIKLTPGGRVKVLDFGLSKALSIESSPESMANSPTLSLQATQAGIILGTAGYMSPEQARGQEADRRADIWAFGVILLEMLTGTNEFQGATLSDSVARILKEEPDWQRLPPEFPGLRNLLGFCLSKDVSRRLHSITDARLMLVESLEQGDQLDQNGRDGSHKTPLRPFGLGLVTGVVLMALTAWLSWSWADNEALPDTGLVHRTIIDLSEKPLRQRTFIGFDNIALAISPDGSQLVYVGSNDAGTALFLRDLASYDISQLPGTEGALNAFFSPDGRWLGFLTSERVMKMSLRGDPPQVLSDIQVPMRATWSEEDSIYVTHNGGSALSRVPASGGPAELIADLDSRFPSAQWIHISDVLPDGSAALAVISSRSASSDYADTYWIDLETLDSKLIVRNGYGALYVADDHIVFARGGKIHGVRFDRNLLQTVGEAVPIGDDVRTESLTGKVQLAVSRNGHMVYAPGEDTAVGKLAWVDRRGSIEFLPVPEQIYLAPSISPDGLRVAVDIADVNDYVWLWDIQREEGRKLVEGRYPVWSPDSQAIAFLSRDSENRWNLSVQDVDPALPRRFLRSTEHMQPPSTWSPSGRTIGVYSENYVLGFFSFDTDQDLVSIPNKGSDYQLFPSFSPDGRYVAYASTETGRFEIWVRSFPDGDIVRQVSVEGGLEPVWCRNGELFFRTGDQWLVTSVRTSPELEWDRPQELFRTEFVDTPALSYDVTPDGQRILLIKRTENTDLTRVHLVTHWLDELKRLTLQNANPERSGGQE